MAPVVIAAATATTIPAIMLADKQTYAAASYDFGILKAYVQWIGRKIQNDTTVAASSLYAGAQLNRTAQQIGVRSFITPAIEGWASAGLGRYTAAGTNNPTANFSAWQLGSNYWLSKRTNLYAAYGSFNQSSPNSSAVSTVSSMSGMNYAVGLRHTF